jgi:hypothetical protein
MIAAKSAMPARCIVPEHVKENCNQKIEPLYIAAAVLASGVLMHQKQMIASTYLAEQPLTVDPHDRTVRKLFC